MKITTEHKQTIHLEDGQIITLTECNGEVRLALTEPSPTGERTVTVTLQPDDLESIAGVITRTIHAIAGSMISGVEASVKLIPSPQKPASPPERFQAKDFPGQGATRMTKGRTPYEAAARFLEVFKEGGCPFIFVELDGEPYAKAIVSYRAGDPDMTPILQVFEEPHDVSDPFDADAYTMPEPSSRFTCEADGHPKVFAPTVNIAALAMVCMIGRDNQSIYEHQEAKGRLEVKLIGAPDVAVAHVGFRCNDTGNAYAVSFDPNLCAVKIPSTVTANPLTSFTIKDT
jgi:hypothetical protein